MPKIDLKLRVYNKRNNHNDQKVLDVLGSFKVPVSFELISLLTDMRKDKVSSVLKSLEKFGLIEKRYKRLTSFWSIK
jgi:RIO-like serine/threonine protein kinase